jgi:nitrogen fixation NifU-like protein
MVWVIAMAETYGYSEKVMEIFREPHNMGEIKDADAVGKVGNPACGDLMWMFLKMEKSGSGLEDHVIRDVKVKTFGCVAAISTSSVLTDLIKGKTLKQAMGITKQDIVDVLNGLPDKKVHCSILAIDALKEAVYDYYRRNKQPVPDEIKKVHERVETVTKQIEDKNRR